MRYVYLWFKFAQIRLLINLYESYGALFFILGKFVRFGLIGIFILSLSTNVGEIKGYDTNQLILVYLLFNFFDLTSQFFFRGIYVFRRLILSGGFDRDLIKPVSPIFSALMTHMDFLDIPLWLLNSGLLFVVLKDFNLPQLLVFVALVINGLIIIAGIHIVVASCAILWHVGDQLINIYRDFSAMARFPIDIYGNSVRILMSTLVPIAIAYTLPAKFLFGHQNLISIIYAFGISFVFFGFSIVLWKQALRRYTSASS